MNVLLLTPTVPFPPDSGPTIKTYHVVRHLAAHHRVTLVTFTHNDHEESCADALREFCADVYTVRHRPQRFHQARALAALFKGRPFSITRASSREMHDLLRQLVYQAARDGQPFDIVHADQLIMAQFAEPLPVPRLLDAHHAEWAALHTALAHSKGWQRLLLKQEQRLLRYYEGRICSAFEGVTVASEEERQALLAVMPRKRDITVIPATVDVENEAPVARGPQANGILSLATMHRPPNADAICWFARDIYPLVRRAVAGSRLYICGANPSAEVQALPDRDSSIEVVGYAADPQPYMARSACLIVPLRHGGGMRATILDALARGIPVVSTAIGCQDMDLTPGEHLLVANTASDFADAVALLLRDPELGARLAAAGRRHMHERYARQSVCPLIDTVYHQIVHQQIHADTLRSTHQTFAPL